MTDTVKTRFFLTAAYNGGRISLRTTKGRPDLAKNEIAILCNLSLPKALFEKPALTANITVPEDAVPQTEVTLDLASNIEELIQQHLGVSMTVGIQEPDEG